MIIKSLSLVWFCLPFLSLFLSLCFYSVFGRGEGLLPGSRGSSATGLHPSLAVGRTNDSRGEAVPRLRSPLRRLSQTTRGGSQGRPSHCLLRCFAMYFSAFRFLSRPFFLFLFPSFPSSLFCFLFAAFLRVFLVLSELSRCLRKNKTQTTTSKTNKIFCCLCRRISRRSRGLPKSWRRSCRTSLRRFRTKARKSGCFYYLLTFFLSFLSIWSFFVCPFCIYIWKHGLIVVKAGFNPTEYLSARYISPVGSAMWVL